MLGLCVAPPTPPARLGQGQKIVAGSGNTRTEEGGGEKNQASGWERPRQLVFTRAEGNTATSH